MLAKKDRREDERSSADPESYIPFKIHPRVFASLGADLVTNDVVAVIELIKNCYDATATRVDVTFGSDEQGPTLDILDNGVGMDRDIIERAWSVVATPYRLEHPQTRSGHVTRRVSGAKGLGRLSAARLGTRLDVLTKTADGPCWHLTIDWLQLADEDSLDTCVIGCTRYKGKTPFEGHGTRIRILDLKAEWDEERVGELQENVARLISPFSKVEDFRIYLTAPTEGKTAVPAEIVAPEFLKKPPYAIRGHVTASGEVRARYEFSPVAQGRPRQKPVALTWAEIQERSEIAKRLGGKRPTCGPFEFEIRAWDIGSEDTREIAEHFETAKGSIRKAIRVHKGISVYRDNILVLPKSDQARDWLGLDLRRVSRVGTRLSTSQIVGYVSITADANPQIEDTSDRERLALNTAVSTFEEILKTIVAVLEEERDDDRRKPTEETRLETLLEGVNANELVEEITSFAEEGEASDEVVLRAKAHSARLDAVRDTLQKRFVYYSRLATVGTIAEMLVHEIRNRTTAIGRFLRTAQEHFNDEMPEQSQLKNASSAVAALESLATTFAPLANRSFRRGRRDSMLEESFGRCMSLLETQIKDVKASVRYPQSGSTRVNVDPGELDAIVLNLLDNALYWLSKVDDDRKLEVSLRKLSDGKQVRVTISDSGPGVSEKDADRIFLPGVTRKPGGIGMGLTVASELISDHGGRISLVQPGKIGGATFTFELPVKAGNAS
jgi:signal transduction histidine kinase